MASEPDLLDAFRKQCKSFGPEVAFMMWQGQVGIEQDDMIDVLKEMGVTP